MGAHRQLGRWTIGISGYRDIGDGSYCILDCYPWENLDEAEILVLVSFDDVSVLRALYEVYVSADGILEGGTFEQLIVDDIAGIGMDVYLPDAGGMSWVLATREKPRSMLIDEKRLCVIGTLTYVESCREVETASWAIVDTIDPRTVSGGLTTQRTLAFLDTSVVVLPEEGSYVEVHGVEIGALTITGSRLPVIQPAEITTLP